MCSHESERRWCSPQKKKMTLVYEFGVLLLKSCFFFWFLVPPERVLTQTSPQKDKIPSFSFSREIASIWQLKLSVTK